MARKIVEYRHPSFCSNWTELVWHFPVEKLAYELASDWLTAKGDKRDIQRIAAGIEIRVVEPSEVAPHRFQSGAF